jgi:hypothetical protein
MLRECRITSFTIQMDMSQGCTTPDGRRQQLCGTPTEAREAEAGQTPDGQSISIN